MLLSITRLKLRSWLQIPRFLSYSSGSIRQASQSAGLISGKTVFEKGSAFWTLTLWQDQAAMQQFMGSGAHLRAMPKLRDWCQEACVTHLPWSDSTLPNPEQALSLLKERGKFSVLKKPSPLHKEGKLPEKLVIRYEGSFFP